MQFDISLLLPISKNQFLETLHFMLIPDLLDKEGVSVTMGSRSGNSDSWREDHRAFMQLIDNDPGTSLSTLVTGDEGMHL